MSFDYCTCVLSTVVQEKLPLPGCDWTFNIFPAKLESPRIFVPSPFEGGIIISHCKPIISIPRPIR